jgi:TatD DNase family protein
LLIDSHAHLDSRALREDREAMLERAFAAGVGASALHRHRRGPARCIALEICRQFNGRSAQRPESSMPAPASIRTSAGDRRRSLAKLDSLLAEPEVIACGEIGLDYYHEGAPHASSAKGSSPTGNRRQPQAAHPHSLPAPRTERTDAWDDTLRDPRRALALHRPGRHDALLRRRLVRRGARSTWAS